MTKAIDSRIEEWIGGYLPWFDSRRSGDPAGYLHKVLWVSFASGGFWLFGFPAWYGGAVYCVLYVAFRKVPGFIKAWRKWRRGESKLGPFRDNRTHSSGIHFGFATDAILDILTAVFTTWLYSL